MAKISGYLKDGAGKAVAECIIILSALKTSNQVIEQIESYTTAKDGFYDINALTGQYAVTLTIAGHPPKKVGVITVYSDSIDGTLNDFLTNGVTNDDITPLFLSQLIEERQKAQDAALSAQNYATEVSSTLANVVKKSGESSQTVNGILSVATLQENGKRVYSPNNKPTASDMGALPVAGGTLTGDISIKKSTPRQYFIDSSGSGAIMLSTKDDFRFYDYKNTSSPFFTYNYATKIGSFWGSSFNIGGVQALKQGDYGLFVDKTPVTLITKLEQLANMRSGERLFAKDSSATILPSSSHGYLTKLGARDISNGGTFMFIDHVDSGEVFIGRHLKGTNSIIWQELVTTANSTVDSNGFYKKASPICRLFGNDNITEVDGFKIVGCGLVNSEADGVIAKRIDVGHYEIHGSLGFAKEGWYITLPEDANGNKKIFAEYSTDDNNIITVKTFTRKFDTEQCEVIAGKPIDITAERWIDIRLEIPVNEVIEETNL